jgi:hypothetical protein
VRGRNAGPYIGYELDLAVPTRDVCWTNFIYQTTLGPDLPGVITTCNLAAAGSRSGDTIVDALIASKRRFTTSTMPSQPSGCERSGRRQGAKMTLG